MNGFILIQDFNAIATEEDMVVLSSDNINIIKQCNAIAIAEACAYLSVKYNVEKLFADPKLYSETAAYKINDTVYIIDEDGKLLIYTCVEDTTPGTELTDTDYFINIDLRDQKLLQVVMAISLFYIHQRLSPNNIPTFRVIAYDGNGNPAIMSAIKWLTNVQEGKLFPFGWAKNTGDTENTEESLNNDVIGDETSNGILFGNDMLKDYIWYNNLHDKNII